MNKLLFSAAVIAISGSYVAYENFGGQTQSFDPNGTTPLAAYIAPTALKVPTVPSPGRASATPNVAPVQTTAQLLPASSAASATGTAAPAAAAPSGNTDSIGALIANSATSQPVPAATMSAPSLPESSTSVAAAQVVPMPLPRPANAPQVASATSSRFPLPAAQQVAATQAVASPQGAYKNGSYRGISADAYYGRVQVEAIISSGRLTSVKILDYPNDRRTSRYIASQSLPLLVQESISAQSGNVDMVSGATLTSNAYIQSLKSALSAARNRGGNA